MIWVAVLLLAGLALAPLAVVLRRAPPPRGRQEADLDLHRAQLAELDRDLAEGRIAKPEHATATLEVQRRLLTAAGAAEPAPARGSLAPIVAVLLLVPLGALALYSIDGTPGMPSAPLAERKAANAQHEAEGARLAAKLRASLARLDPKSDAAWQALVLLGGVEEARGDYEAAATAWRSALGTRFEPTLAVQAAEAASRAEGKVSPASAALFRRALQEAPADAPWRSFVQARLAEAG